MEVGLEELKLKLSVFQVVTKGVAATVAVPCIANV
ncbi:hypothetical protein FLACHUCJ7_00022 [Flavobacterium chungangense]|uniref:Uncharacterized protein n=1 Tax=Flavobacterium chungangense TaxID=554283 RepID=A0A6V6YLT6_9FLAO|nr:hypothetical protein FLACHUCJ7_00022 [Flavobacterium chungangense]